MENNARFSNQRQNSFHHDSRRNHSVTRYYAKTEQVWKSAFEALEASEKASLEKIQSAFNKEVSNASIEQKQEFGNFLYRVKELICRSPIQLRSFKFRFSE